MKDRYFAHDFGARNDPKLIDLQMEMKGTGLAIWWCLVEMLWENDGYLPMNFRSVAFSIRWARPADVERVVTGFGLFENDGERFWSGSALARIREQRDIAEEASERGRKAAKTRWKSDENADAMQAQSACIASGMPIKKEINKKIKKENIYLSRADAREDTDTQKIFEIFFFDLNAADPAAEVRRFTDHYSARGWRLGDGNPVSDVAALARNWKPERSTKRFRQTFLRWYRRLWEECGSDPAMLEGLASGELDGHAATLRYADRATAERVRALAAGKPSAEGIDIAWKFNNNGK